jgi:enoyl-CoA hydratase/carnithine racemase
MSELLFERRGNVGLLTLNRPERRNALNRGLLEAICEQIDALREDRSVRVLILRGAGDRAFCAGADLKERRGMSQEEVEAFVPLIRDTMTRVASFPRPTLAAVEGVALGGGLELAIACDFRVASKTSMLGLPEVGLAIIPGAGGTQRLPRLVGLAHARELVLTARRVPADEAARMGLVQRVVEPGEVLEASLTWAAEIARNAPLALEAAKEAMERGWDLPLAEGLEHELECYQRIIPTRDRLEALEAFAEKRPPVYEGR